MPTKFRPCIDLHDGHVKQIVGGTLRDGGQAEENFVSAQSSSHYAKLYAADGLTGGHVIMLGPGNEDAAKEALASYPHGMQVGGGITASTAQKWLDAGASHVIVTSWVFRDGELDTDRLDELSSTVGRDRLVLDLSCRKRDGEYFVVTNRWQTFTSLKINASTLSLLASRCCEFLVHGVDVEGKRLGVDDDLIALLAIASPIPVTYAGGANSIYDLDKVQRISRGKVDLTIGSALDIFGGDIRYINVVEWHFRNIAQQRLHEQRDDGPLPAES